MPSVDVIRNITVRGSAPGVDDTTAALNRLTDSIKSANQNLAQSNQVANDNSSGFRLTGESAALAANHLRQAAEAAYAFSPAFRGVVNEMAPAALGAANTALAAVATGIVTATNVAGTGVLALASAAEKAAPGLVGYTSGVRSAGIAMEAFNPTVTTAAGSLLSFLSPALRLVGWFALAYDGIKMVGEAWDLGNQKLAEYVALSEKAVASGVSTDFFQRITKAADDAKQPVDAMTTALAKLNTATADKLGGTPAQKGLNDLVTAGNFGGNSGVGQLSDANTTQQKFQAISNLIDQAMQKGQRLAALDVAKTFLGDAVAGNLAKDSDYLNKMLAAADEIKSADLVPQASIDNAVELQNRLDAAEKILEERWHPIQDLLAQGGIAMKEAWVNIVENMASAFDWASKLLATLGAFPSWAMNMLNRGATGFMNLTTTPESRAASESSLGISSNPTDIAMLAARQRLGSGLGNPANVSSSTDQINSIQNKIFPDTSKDPNAKAPESAAYDRAAESILKYIETTKAAALAVSDAAGEQEKFKVIAQLTAAAEKDGTTITASLRAEMNKLGEQAGAAADALAKAKMASQLDFSGKTTFLSSEDVAIATQLKGIYGNDVPAALNSTYAAAIKTDNAFKGISSSIETNLTSGLTDIVSGTKSVSAGFADMSTAIIKAIEQMIIKLTIVEPLMQSLQAAAGGSGLSGFFGGLFGGASGVSANGSITGAIGPTSVGGAPLVGLHAGGIVGHEATFSRYVHPAYFDDAPRFHSGGIAGDEVPIIARRGEGVFTAGQMAALGGGSQAPGVTIHNYTQAQPSVKTGPNGDVTITLGKAMDQAVGQSLSSGEGMRTLNRQFGVKQFMGS